MNKIGILEAGRSSSTSIIEQYGDYPQMFIDMLAPLLPDTKWITYRIVSGNIPSAIAECDAWIITGSVHCACDDFLWIHQTKDFIRKCYTNDIKLLGICFGHQIIADALGGRVQPDIGWGIGVHTYQLQETIPCYEFSKEKLSMPIYHSDQVVELPPDTEVVAGSDFCKYGVLHYPGHALTTQAHPEMSAEYIKVLIDRDRGTVLSDEDVNRFAKSLTLPLDSNLFAQAMVRFLKK